MKELKTLKDLMKIERCKVDALRNEMNNAIGHSVCNHIENGLKAEAVKWVKELSKPDGLCYSPTQILKHFFNITEEDLK